ncbi:MAG: hypothetical protein IT428_24405 [Planctomycetaceae bacterium]|nr:hypothetical protein [Planctomycetaceae bacterium]
MSAIIAIHRKTGATTQIRCRTTGRVFLTIRFDHFTQLIKECPDPRDWEAASIGTNAKEANRLIELALKAFIEALRQEGTLP